MQIVENAEGNRLQLKLFRGISNPARLKFHFGHLNVNQSSCGNRIWTPEGSETVRRADSRYNPEYRYHVTKHDLSQGVSSF